MTEHISDVRLSVLGETNKSDRSIHDRDLEWMLSSDVVVADVSTPSLGVGYEIGRALERGKKILCLYRPQGGRELSAMIAGCSDLEMRGYRSLDHAKEILEKFFRNIKPC